MMRLPLALSALLTAALLYPAFLQAQPDPVRNRSARDSDGLAVREQSIQRMNNQILGLLADSPLAVNGRKEASTAAASPVFERRAEALLELIREDPAAALRNALPPDVAAQLSKAFPGAADRIERYTTVSGVLEVEIEDGLSNSTLYRAVRTGFGRIPLHLADERAAGAAQSGDSVEAGGLLLAGEIAADTLNGDSAKPALGIAAQGGRCSTTGAQRIAVLKVKFPGTSPTLSNADLEDWIFGSAGQTVNRFWQENSNGAAWAEGGVFPAGVDSWFTLDREYSCSESSALRQAALIAADSAVDFRNYTRVVIVFPKPSSGCSFAGRASVGCWVSNPDGGAALSYALQSLPSMNTRSRAVELTTHEGGHMLGLYHAAAAEYGADAVGAPGSFGTRKEYGDRYSTMGFWNLGHYGAPHKSQLGWLQNSTRISTAGTYRIQPASQAPNSSGGATQALQIERGAETLWVEFRRRLGAFFSSAVADPRNGALLHLDNGSAQSLLLDFTPGSGSSAGTYYSADFHDSTLDAGLIWSDPYSDLSLSVMSASDSGLDLSVGYGATPTCVEVAPQLTLSPVSKSAAYPAPAEFQLQLRNNDGVGCSSSAFSLSAAVKLGSESASGIETQLGTAVLTAAPGAIATTILRASPTIEPSEAVSYRVEAATVRGAEQTLSAAALVVLPGENTPPTLTIASPIDGSTFEHGNPVSLQGTALDAQDGNISGNIAWTSSLDGGLGTNAGLSKVLSRGLHLITASIEDSGGMAVARTVTVTVAEPVANTEPAVVIIAPISGSEVTAGTPISLRGSAVDAEDGDISSSLNWTSSLDGDLGVAAAVTNTLSVGSHLVAASVVDSGGMVSARTVAVTVVPAPTPNTAPAVAILSPADGAQVGEGMAVTLAGSAVDAEDGDISRSLTWTSSLDGWVGEGANPTATLSAGLHAITASVVDSNGLRARESIALSVQGPPPPPIQDKVKVEYVRVTVIPRGSRVAAEAAVRLIEVNERPVERALLNGYWTINGEMEREATKLRTDADGVAHAKLNGRIPVDSVVGFVVNSVSSVPYTGPILPVWGSAVVP